MHESQTEDEKLQVWQWKDDDIMMMPFDA